MRLPKFEVLQPQTVQEAYAMAESAGSAGKVLAGGTDLLPIMKLRGFVPEQVINLRSVAGLAQLEANGSELQIGSMVGLDRLAVEPAVVQNYPMLAAAARQVASYQLRNMATIGGNVCLDSKCWYYNQSHQWWKARPLCFKRGGDRCYVVKGGEQCYSLSCADTVPALIAMGAKLKLVSSGGEREVAVEDFYTGEGRSVNLLQPGELLVEIQVPEQPKASGWGYIKISPRGAVDFALAEVAVRLNLDQDGTCIEARIVLNAVAPQPLRATGAENLILGKELEDEVIKEAAALAASEARPLSSIWTSVYYRRRLIKVLVERALQQAVTRAKGGNCQ